MTYAARAKRFLAERSTLDPVTCEKSEISEKRAEAASRAIATPTTSASDKFMPPEDCLGPIVCRVLGPCDNPCGQPYAAFRTVSEPRRTVECDGRVWTIFD